MSERIEAGDLVQVVHGCCDKWGGQVFIVGKILLISACCPKCGYGDTELLAANADTASNNPMIFPVRWLKKFPPLDEPASDGREVRKPVRVPEVIGAPDNTGLCAID